MLIPVRCFTCGKVIADKWTTFEKNLQAVMDDPSLAEGQPSDNRSGNAPQRLSCAKDVPEVAPAGKVLNALGITKICCRRHFLTNVDLMDSM